LSGTIWSGLRLATSTPFTAIERDTPQIRRQHRIGGQMEGIFAAPSTSTLA
jgi:hypothetical protein